MCACQTHWNINYSLGRKSKQKFISGQHTSTFWFRGVLDHPTVPPLADVILMKAYSRYCLLCASAAKWVLVCLVIQSPHWKNCKTFKQGPIFRWESVFFFTIGPQCTTFAVIRHLLLFSSAESTPSSALEICINRSVSYFCRLAIWSFRFFLVTNFSEILFLLTSLCFLLFLSFFSK